MLTRYRSHSYCIAVLISIFVLPVRLWSQVIFKIPLYVTDNGSGNALLWFGVHPEGGRCLDQAGWMMNFGECDSMFIDYLPPDPPGLFEAGFQDMSLSSCFDYEWQDIKQYTSRTQIDTFELFFLPAWNEGYPFTFSWPSDLSTLCDSMRLQDPYGGIFVDVNMLTQTSYKLTRSTVSFLNIFLYGVKTTPSVTPTPVLTYPANVASVIDSSVTFRWPAVTGMLHWTHVQVAQDSLFENIVLQDTVAEDSLHVMLAPRAKYFWRARALGSYFWSCFSAPSSFTTVVPPTSIMETLAPLPSWYSLSQNCPNPFNPSTRMNFTVEHTSQIRITVFDVLGRDVMTLVDGTYRPGVFGISWNGRNASGMQMPSGVYYARMLATDAASSQTAAPSIVCTRKMLMLR